MALAFKEWGYIVDALGKGKQSIIIRKGGIAEDGSDFTIRGKKFFLLPTQYHQANEMIKPGWLADLNGDQYQVNSDTVRIEYYAQVADSRIIKDWNVLEKLDSQHAWKPEVILERFNRWEKMAHLLILQIYKLDRPFELTLKPEYTGCKSWIEIDEETEFSGKPVMNPSIISHFAPKH